MTLDWLKSMMLDGTPIYYIQYGHVYTSSVASIMAVKPNAVYITLDDGVTADVVEVVRCKDCVNRRTTRCQMYWESDDHKEQYSWENDNEFCSEGCRATAQEGATTCSD